MTTIWTNDAVIPRESDRDHRLDSRVGGQPFATPVTSLDGCGSIELVGLSMAAALRDGVVLAWRHWTNLLGLPYAIWITGMPGAQIRALSTPNQTIHVAPPTSTNSGMGIDYFTPAPGGDGEPTSADMWIFGRQRQETPACNRKWHRACPASDQLLCIFAPAK